MKTLRTSLIWCTFSMSLFAQEPAAATPPATAGRLSVEFSKIALKATLTIKNTNHTPLSRGDQSRVQDLVDDVSITAETPKEKKAFEWIHVLQISRETESIMFQTYVVQQRINRISGARENARLDPI